MRQNVRQIDYLIQFVVKIKILKLNLVFKASGQRRYTKNSKVRMEKTGSMDHKEKKERTNKPKKKKKGAKQH